MLGYMLSPEFSGQVHKEEFFLMSLFHLNQKDFADEAKLYLEPSFVDEMVTGQIRGDEFLSAVNEVAVGRAEKHFIVLED